MKHYTQLSMEDRCQFNVLLQMELSIKEIAKRLGRHSSTIYRELKRNAKPNSYSPGKAHKKALSRKSRLCNIERFPTLRSYVMKRLKLGWSPEQIAGRLKRKKSKYVVCHETIYRFIYKHPKKKMFHYLKNKKPNRRRKSARIRQDCRFGDKRLITKRPSIVEDRVYSGHWEGDCVEFKGTKKKSVTTLLERKTRMLIIIKNDSMQSKEVMLKISNKFKSLPQEISKTITFDQGSEFANFNILEESLSCSIFYCHAHSPWEKGSNENMNGRLRRFLPRDWDIVKTGQKQLDMIADIMNNTPRKCLDFRTPKEMFLKHLKYFCRT